ncbi:scavenger receptor cysteine-rich type 1 protein M160 [Notolabrus celidotus]|uniref:scavenger receptor cysteine-rich type 1 protein M160 n=1 Tax=Notolabrus celidotus TaxID=1203425 RepID=UPI00148FB909|nr:scavenger receptor cysteine-rich type 1 protein M160 [Notolabrus celidotus]
MTRLLLLLFVALIEPVNLQGYVGKLILKDQEPCKGHLEVYRDNLWGYVGDTDWNDDTEEVVCRSTHCGKPVTNSTGEVFRPIDSKVWLNELRCRGNESHLWECGNPGWGISEYRRDSVKTIKCSRKIEISLDGYKCAGAVKFTDENAASGYFCNENWGSSEANLLCSSLNCGQFKEIPKQPWFGWKDFQSSKKMKMKCVDTSNLNSLWQCADQEATSCKNVASVICTGFQRVQLRGSASNVCSGSLEKLVEEKWNRAPQKTNSQAWCQQMHCGTVLDVTEDGLNLTCSDKVKVVLKDKDKESKCYGTVHVEVNSTSKPVCGSAWTNKEAEVVCREKNCGKVLDKSSEIIPGQGIMDHVKCSGSEASLWHCLAKRDNNPFRCKSQAYVVCSGSVDVRLVDGPGICAGRVEVNYNGQWQRLDKKSWSDANSDTVCRQLKCGIMRKKSNPEEKFSQGSGDFLTMDVECQSNVANISECKFNKQKVNADRKKEAVGITCMEHKVIFLEGEKSCSGMVGVEHDDKTYWLSGSNKTWNEDLARTVCGQMNCGQVLNYTVSPSGLEKDVWPESYNCKANSKSVFGCEKMARPSNHNQTIATVKCTGKFKVNLTEECWGDVNICMGEECGGVCRDTWSNKKSEMLCKNLGCGRAIHLAKNPLQERSDVMFKSLHTTNRTTDLSQCNFIKHGEKETTCGGKAAHVVCSGSVKTQISATSDKCTGNVEVFYEGQYLPVCKKALENTETRNIICMERGCGKAVKLIDSFGPKPGLPGISQIQCAADKNSLNACEITSDKTQCPHVGLQCSGYRRMELKFHTACSGALFVYSEGKRSAVSIEGWTETEGGRLCQDLTCGKFSSIRSIQPITDDFWNSSFSCAGKDNPQSIWECESQTAPSKTEQLFITCGDEPSVTLSEKCAGEVMINKVGVCDTYWNIGYSHLVCQETGCSNAVGHFSEKVPRSDMEYHHVKCERYHSKLGQCKRFKAKCDGKLVSVYCVENVKINTAEKCGGQILVDYRNEWENVCAAAPLPAKHKTQLCEKLECKKRNDSTYSPNNKKGGLVTSLNCTNAHEDIKYCISQGSCVGLKPADIICDGYPPIPPTEGPPSTSMVPLILGLGLLVVFLIVIILVGICIVRRTKRSTNNKYAGRTQPWRESEFESSEYEAIKRKKNEQEHFGQSGFRPEGGVMMESDARSSASFSYDDIEEAAVETQPLTSEAINAGSSGDAFIPEGALPHSRDEVMYEVDDPGENYDDIEASPDVTETKAEVHSSSGTTPDSVPAAPPEAPREGAEGGEEYLVPGQD